MPHTLWLSAIYSRIESALSCTRSDAQGIVDAQPFALARQWALGSDADTAAQAIITASKSQP